MPLYTYHNRPVSAVIHHSWLEWVNWWMLEATKAAQENVWFQKKARHIRAHKLAAIAFAQQYQMMDQWEQWHKPVSAWLPRIDFIANNKKLRIYAVAADEKGEFGPTVVGRVPEKDLGTLDRFILAAWYPPYVDFIGWADKKMLEPYKRVTTYGSTNYALQEIVTKPMTDLLS